MTDRITISPANLLIVAVVTVAAVIAAPIAVYHADPSAAVEKRHD